LGVYWRKSADNLADFFTKALPVQRNKELKLMLMHGSINPANPSLNMRARRCHAYWLRR